VFIVVTFLPREYVDHVIECLHLEHEVSEYFPLAVHFAILAIKAQAHVIMLHEGVAQHRWVTL